MFQIAAEMNLSETAFIIPKNASGPNAFQEASQFGLRWFTPTEEVKLCGHATLATSYVLFNKIGNKSTELRFDTLSGELAVRRGLDGLLDMTFPLDAPEPVEITDDVKLLVASIYGEYHESIEVGLSPSLNYLVVHDPDANETDIVNLDPNITPEAYAAGKRVGVIAVIATAKGTQKDFHSRVFGPWVGIAEDPVTGSAHTVLAPFWQGRLSKKSFSAEQSSKRVGHLEVDIVSDTHVQVSGKAVAVFEGYITL
ncbi:hypothetical protein FBU59_004066 [Linderina macrospora]|uniref:Uncharacterized protein n=1 Tax=Linderina macrospora TaxID=4868 RepID=A0ACC1J6I3_9FUNG|nr:hypothetical protein FBU59_004066 [Linderina macrospora]